jgi:glutamate synthase (NADPH/NADH) small chain
MSDAHGKVRAIQLHQVKSSLDENGRISFAKVDGSDFELEADLVLLALGFTGAEKSQMTQQLDLEFDPRGNILRNASWMTNKDGVFVCGDMGRGQSLVVWAIAEGRSCAASVDRFLTGQTDLPSPIEFNSLAIR